MAVIGFQVCQRWDATLNQNLGKPVKFFSLPLVLLQQTTLLPEGAGTVVLRAERNQQLKLLIIYLSRWAPPPPTLDHFYGHLGEVTPTPPSIPLFFPTSLLFILLFRGSHFVQVVVKEEQWNLLLSTEITQTWHQNPASQPFLSKAQFFCFCHSPEQMTLLNQGWKLSALKGNRRWSTPCHQGQTQFAQ